MTDEQPTANRSQADAAKCTAGTQTDRLTEPARRVLAHIRARTIAGKFACQLWDMPNTTWEAALEELRQSGYEIAWTYGIVADDPTITGGYVLR
jgi:hypothetical protein